MTFNCQDIHQYKLEAPKAHNEVLKQPEALKAKDPDNQDPTSTEI